MPIVIVIRVMTTQPRGQPRPLRGGRYSFHRAAAGPRAPAACPPSRRPERVPRVGRSQTICTERRRPSPRDRPPSTQLRAPGRGRAAACPACAVPRATPRSSRPGNRRLSIRKSSATESALRKRSRTPAVPTRRLLVRPAMTAHLEQGGVRDRPLAVVLGEPVPTVSERLHEWSEPNAQAARADVEDAEPQRHTITD